MIHGHISLEPLTQAHVVGVCGECLAGYENAKKRDDYQNIFYDVLAHFYCPLDFGDGFLSQIKFFSNRVPPAFIFSLSIHSRTTFSFFPGSCGACAWRFEAGFAQENPEPLFLVVNKDVVD